MNSRYKFSEIFQENPDGSISPKKAISVNGVTFAVGVSFGPGITFGGVNFHDYKYLDIAVEEKEDILLVKGFYK